MQGQDKYANISPNAIPFIHYTMGMGMRHFKKVRLPVGAFFESMGQQVTLDIAGAFSNICSAAHTRSIFEHGTWARQNVPLFP